jgi:hypothetical protein
LGEEDVIRIYKYRLSQRVLLTALASIKAPLQCNNSESVTDYKLNVNRNALDSVGDDRTALYACKRHEVRVHHCLQLGNLILFHLCGWPIMDGNHRSQPDAALTNQG